MTLPSRSRAALALAGLAALWCPAGGNVVWGLSLWALWPAAIRLVLTALVVVAAWWPPGPAPDAGPESRGRTWGAVAIAAGLVLFWFFFPARTLLFGDAADLAARFAPGVAVAPRSPLYGAVLDQLRQAFDIRTQSTMLVVMRMLSTACGVLALGLVVAVLRRRRGPAPDAGTVALFLGGGCSLFQGYVEAYALMAVGFLAWTVAAGEPAGARRSVFLLALQLFVIGSHLVGIVLLPLTGVLMLAGVPRRHRRATLIGAAALAVAGLAVLRGAGPLPGLDLDVASRFLAARVRSWSTGRTPLADLLDVTNNLVLAAGPALLGAGLLASTPAGRGALLRVARTPPGSAALLLMAARLALPTGLGAFLDWDFGAAFVLPFQLATATAWSDRAVTPLRHDCGRILPVVAILLALPQGLVLHDPARSVARVAAFRDGRPSPPAAVRAQLDNRLGDALAREGRQLDAAAAFERAASVDPRAVYARRAGTAWQRAGHRPEALAAFSHAVALDSGDVVAREQRAYLLGPSSPRAIEDFEAVLRMAPERANALMGLGAALVAQGDTARACPLLRRAAARYREELERGTGNAQTRRLMEQCLRLAGG